MIMQKLIPLALGLGLALAGGPATAGVTWTSPFTFFEDDDLDFVFRDEGGDGKPTVGDILVTVFEVNKASGNPIDPDELTGVLVLEITDILDLDGDGQVDDLKGGPVSLPGGMSAIHPKLPGMAGAMVAMYLDSAPITDLDTVFPNFSCTSLAQCIDQATDDVLYQVDGMIGDPDEYWFSLNSAGVPYATVLNGLPTATFVSVDFGLTNLFVNTAAGHPRIDESVPCSPVAIALGLCQGNQLVWMQGQGSVLGGGKGLPGGPDPGLIRDGFFGTSDFDSIKQVPEPGSLALLAAGLLGLGASLRRRLA